MRYLSDRHDRVDGIRVLYFYATIRSRSYFSDIALALLSQLCADRDDLPEDLRFMLAAVSASHEQPSTRSVESALEKALRRTPESVFIVIDGLDELPDLEGRRLLDFIRLLQSDQTASIPHIIVASRPTAEVYDFAPKYARIDISSQTSSDVKRLIDNGLEEMESLHEITEMDEVKAELSHFLEAHANGRYANL